MTNRLNTSKMTANIDFVVAEYKTILEDVRMRDRTSWRLLLAYLAGSGAAIAALPSVIGLGFPATEIAVVILGFTYFVVGIFLSLSLYKIRRFVLVDYFRLGEIENAMKKVLDLPDNEPWGRWGEKPYRRLRDEVKAQKGYKRDMIGLMDYGAMFILGGVGLMWLLLSLWILLGRWLGYSTELAALIGCILILSELVWLATLYSLARSEEEKNENPSTSSS